MYAGKYSRRFRENKKKKLAGFSPTRIFPFTVLIINMIKESRLQSFDGRIQTIAYNNIEDGANLTLNQLKKLKEFFEGADVDGEGSLNENEFTKAFARIMNGSSEDELKQWFRRIDANANGSVDWDEFSSYILLNGQHQTATYQKAKFCNKKSKWTPSINEVHKQSVTTAVLHSSRSGTRVFTGSSDATVKVWNYASKSLDATLQMPAWVLSSRMLKNGRRILSSHSDGSISVIDTEKFDIISLFIPKKSASTYRWQGLGKISAPETHHGVSDYTSITSNKNIEALKEKLEQDREKMVLSKTKTRPNVIKTTGLTDIPSCIELVTIGFGSALAGYVSDEKTLLLAGLKNGDIVFYPVVNDHLTSRHDFENLTMSHSHYWSGVHSSSVSGIRWSKSIDNLISISWDGYIKFLNVECCKVSRTLQPDRRTQLTRSLFRLEWNDDRKLLATHGKDPIVQLWNPYMSEPVALLQHPTTVSDMAFNSEDCQLITLTEENLIKVWDIRTFKCVQTLKDNNHIRHLSKLCYNRSVSTDLILCSTYPTSWSSLKTSSPCESDIGGGLLHQQPVSVLLKNLQLANQIIAIDSDAVVTWDPSSGKRSFKYDIQQSIRTACDSGLLPANHEDCVITSVNLDGNGRRLMLGTHYGTILLWNYISGQLLKICNPPVSPGHVTTSEITCVWHCTYDALNFKYIYGTSKNTLNIWQDTEATVSCVEYTFTLPTSDSNEHFTNLAHVPPWTLLLGTSTGRIICYELRNKTLTGALQRVPIIPMSLGRLSTDSKQVSRASPEMSPPSSSISIANIELLPVDDKVRKGFPPILIASCSDSRIQVWDIQQRRLLYHWLPGSKSSSSCNSSLANNRVFTGDETGMVRSWLLDFIEQPSPTTTTFSCRGLHYSVSVVRELKFQVSKTSRITSICAHADQVVVGCSNSKLYAYSQEGCFIGEFGVTQPTEWGSGQDGNTPRIRKPLFPKIESRQHDGSIYESTIDPQTPFVSSPQQIALSSRFRKKTANIQKYASKKGGETQKSFFDSCIPSQPCHIEPDDVSIKVMPGLHEQMDCIPQGICLSAQKLINKLQSEMTPSGPVAGCEASCELEHNSDGDHEADRQVPSLPVLCSDSSSVCRRVSVKNKMSVSLISSDNIKTLRAVIQSNQTLDENHTTDMTDSVPSNSDKKTRQAGDHLIQTTTTTTQMTNPSSRKPPENCSLKIPKPTDTTALVVGNVLRKRSRRPAGVVMKKINCSSPTTSSTDLRREDKMCISTPCTLSVSTTAKKQLGWSAHHRRQVFEMLSLQKNKIKFSEEIGENSSKVANKQVEDWMSVGKSIRRRVIRNRPKQNINSNPHHRRDCSPSLVMTPQPPSKL